VPEGQAPSPTEQEAEEHLPDPADDAALEKGDAIGARRALLMLGSFIAIETYSDGRIISRSAIPKAHVSAMAM
jgi:hypothetical protein